MKTLVLASAILLAIGMTSYAEDGLSPTELAAQNAPAPSDHLDNSVCDPLESSAESTEQYAQQGCCSWHNGVCGCSGARVQCCDGTLSPSCKCNSVSSASSRRH